MLKRIALISILAGVLFSCDLSTAPTTQQEVVDKVTSEIKSSLSDPNNFMLGTVTIDTIDSNSPIIDPDCYPHLYGAALYMGLVEKTYDLSQKTKAQEDLDSFGGMMDSVRSHMKPVMAQVERKKGQKGTTAGYIVCVDYKVGPESKSEVYYYDIAADKVKKESWEPEMFGQMLELLDEFTEKPELLNM